MLLHFVALFLALWAPLSKADFGITETGSVYRIDAGSANPLVFEVQRSSCDITSILYRGDQLQYSGKGTHIASGLGSASVSARQDGSTIIVTCETSTLTHYLVVREGDSTIFMATYTTQEPSVGELRFIARLDSGMLPNDEPFGRCSVTAGASSTVEGSDVFVVDGETRSKFYSSERFIDDERHCVSGDDRRVCMIIPDPTSYESASGGPFFRDIDTNNGGDMNALYYYMNSGHVQTEDYRMGLHGPYAMIFSRSGTPDADLDLSFFEDLNIKGLVPVSGRGKVSGTASGPSSDFPWVVHWTNPTAQYWTYTDGGSFTSPPMKPGTYEMILYQDEYQVASQQVSVGAGDNVSMDISGSVVTGNTIWRIGDWNGRPTGFLNADLQLRMHPSDSRMANWGPITYTVGSSSTGDFPMALFKEVNNPVTIRFNLNSGQTGAATLRVGTTLSFAGGRPSVQINDYTPDAPGPPVEIESRGVTRGAYRGYGEVYDYDVPSGTLREGSNTITITVISGSSGSGFLSPNIIFDCVELFQ